MSGFERLAISHPLQGVEESELAMLRHCSCLGTRYRRLTYQKRRTQTVSIFELIENGRKDAV